MGKPEFKDVVAAKSRIAGEAVVTPLLHNRFLDEKLGARVFLKAECLQRTGSFKFRGAFNALSVLGDKARKHGVIACSSGNHAQGLAEAGRIAGVDVTIVMPEDAPALKRARTERSGAKVVPYDRATGDRDAITNAIAEETGAIVVHPFNNKNVMAGQGTAGLEIVEALSCEGISADMVLVPTGGGGLLAGTVLSISNGFPMAGIYAVEPEGFDDYRRSLAAGKRVANEVTSGSICDALLTPQAGKTGYAISSNRVVGGLVVSDEEVLDAIAFAFHELKIIVEPGGAVALAALLSGKVECRGKNIVAVLSGGNIDPAILQQALVGYETHSSLHGSV